MTRTSCPVTSGLRGSPFSSFAVGNPFRTGPRHPSVGWGQTHVRDLHPRHRRSLLRQRHRRRPRRLGGDPDRSGRGRDRPHRGRVPHHQQPHGADGCAGGPARRARGLGRRAGHRLELRGQRHRQGLAGRLAAQGVAHREQAARGQPRPVGAHDPGAGAAPQRAPGAGARARRPRGQRARGSPRPGRRQGRGAAAGSPLPSPRRRPSGATATRSSSASTSDPPRTLVVGPGAIGGFVAARLAIAGWPVRRAGARRDPPDPARAAPCASPTTAPSARCACGWWRTRARRSRWRSPWSAPRASTPRRPRGRCVPPWRPGRWSCRCRTGSTTRR